MWRSARRSIALLLLILLPFSFLSSQDEPVPYTPKEFPQWARDLRRAEIIFIGSFPLSIMFTTLIYDFSIYAASGFDPLNNLGTNRDDEDIFRIVMISLSVSTLIALADFIIEKKQRKEEQEKMKDFDTHSFGSSNSDSEFNLMLEHRSENVPGYSPFVPSFHSSIERVFSFPVGSFSFE